MLTFARQHGWPGRLTSGYRTNAAAVGDLAPQPRPPVGRPARQQPPRVRPSRRHHRRPRLGGADPRVPPPDHPLRPRRLALRARRVPHQRHRSPLLVTTPPPQEGASSNGRRSEPRHPRGATHQGPRARAPPATRRSARSASPSPAAAAATTATGPTRATTSTSPSSAARPRPAASTSPRAGGSASTAASSWREWEAQDGSKRQAVEVIANDIFFLDSRRDDDSDSGSGEWRADMPDQAEKVPAAAAAAAARRRRRHPVLGPRSAARPNARKRPLCSHQPCGPGRGRDATRRQLACPQAPQGPGRDARPVPPRPSGRQARGRGRRAAAARRGP